MHTTGMKHLKTGFDRYYLRTCLEKSTNQSYTFCL